MRLTEDSLTPGHVIGLLEVKENTQDKLTFSENCRDMFQTEMRMSRGTKPAKAELKERKDTKGFEDPNEVVGDDPLQHLAEAAKQGDGPKAARVDMGLPRIWDGDDPRLTLLEGSFVVSVENVRCVGC